MKYPKSQKLWQEQHPRVPLTREALAALNLYKQRHGLANLSLAVIKAVTEQPKTP